MLRSMGREFGQGFYFAKPLEPLAWQGSLRADGTVETNDLRTGEGGRTSPKRRQRRAAA
jgi:hypothetical protein